jgi:spore germination protein GerM
VGVGVRSLASDGASLGQWLPWLRRIPITLFYLDDAGELIPVSRNLDDEATPTDLVDEFLAGPAAGSGLHPVLLGDSIATDVTLADGVLTVVFAEGQLAPYPSAARALAESLMSWPGVERVAVTVDGTLVEAGDQDDSLLFFYDEDRDLLIATASGGNEPRSVLASYLEGPQTSDLVGLPSDVELLSFSFNRANGLLSLDFTYRESVREFATDHPDAMRRVLEGLIASMVDFPDVQAVRLDFEGHNTLGLGQCADLLRTPQARPDILNDERILARVEA